MMESKQCTGCKQLLALSEFTRNGPGGKYRQSKCKSCRNRENKRHYKYEQAKIQRQKEAEQMQRFHALISWQPPRMI